MAHSALEVADIFRCHGPTYRRDKAGRLSRDQLRVMGAVEACRTAALGGHVERCTDCGHQRIAYNSCRNRHCPRCQGRAATQWLEHRQSELLPVPYFHVVFTLPAALAAIAYHNKAVAYNILFQAAAETLKTIAADPKHLGAEIGLVAVLHTWGQTLTHHPHVHCIVPGGGLSPDGQQWIACRPGFFLPVRVLSRLYRRLFLEQLEAAFAAGKLQFFSQTAPLAEPRAFGAQLAELRKSEWIVYAKPPFAGPEQVLAYLSRYTHRVAIANSRLAKLEEQQVSFRWRDYRHPQRRKTMRLSVEEFIRRFLLHVLPAGFHRIRHYGMLANGHRQARLGLCRRLLQGLLPNSAEAHDEPSPQQPRPEPWQRCPSCGGPMVTVEILLRADRHHRIKRLDSS
jgi:hypothetical protein